MYGGTQPAAYAASPLETVNYAGCHDGEVLSDQLVMKAPDGADAVARARMASLAAAAVAFSQVRR